MKTFNKPCIWDILKNPSEPDFSKLNSSAQCRPGQSAGLQSEYYTCNFMSRGKYGWFKLYVTTKFYFQEASKNARKFFLSFKEEFVPIFGHASIILKVQI